jgi:hypothetical protein
MRFAELGFSLALPAAGEGDVHPGQHRDISKVSSVGHCSRKPNVTRMKPPYCG